MALRPHLSMGLLLSMREGAVCVRCYKVYHIAHLRVNSEKVLGVESKSNVRITRGNQFLGRLHP